MLKNSSIYIVIITIISILIYNSSPVNDNRCENLIKKIAKKDRIEFAIQQEFESTVDPKTGVLPSGKLYEIAERLQNNADIQSRNSSAIVWEERGPNNIGGRTRTILVDKGDITGNTVFAASVSGGIWKCTNAKSNNPTWTQVSGLMNNLAISCMVQDPSYPNTLYAGTGEGYFNIDAQKGNGIWKSTNGGSNWFRLNATANDHFNYTQKMAIDSEGRIYASTRNSGLMKSTDGGNSWIKVLGENLYASTDKANDLVINEDGTIFASMGIFNTDGIYRSRNAGSSWVKVSNGLPTNGYERIEIAGTPQNDQLIYALFQDTQSSNCSGIYKSTNQGASWVMVNQPQAYGMSNFARNQAWYNLSLAIHPGDQNTIIVGGIDLHLSRNGGTSWFQISQWAGLSNLPYVHADQHEIRFEGSNSVVYFGNDGGIARSMNIDAPIPEITPINSGYNVTQFYGAAIHPEGTNPLILAGAQDNGTQKFSHPGMNATTEIAGGDGSYCHIDQADPHIQIASYVFNNYYLSTDGGVNFALRSFNNYGRFANPSVYDQSNKKLYAGNSGGSYFRWNDPATGGTDTDNVAVNAFGTASVTAIGLSPGIPNRAYFGLNNGKLVMVENAQSGNSKSGTLILDASMGSISSIAIDEDNEDHLLVSFSNYGIQSILETNNGGQNWQSVEGNLPDMPVRCILFHPENNNAAMIATDLGIWQSSTLNASSTQWTHDNNALSYVRVDMLKFRPGDNYLLAATHGRGLFTSTSFVRPKVNFEVEKITVSEQASSGQEGDCYLNKQSLQIPVSISTAPSNNITITFSIDNSSTAEVGQDFKLLTNSLQFSSNGALEKYLYIEIIDEAINENQEFLKIKMNGNSSYIGNKNELLIDVIDDDVDPGSTSGHASLIGSVQGSVYLYPFGGYYEDGRTQILYKSEELTAAGMVAGNLSKLALHIAQKYSTSAFNNFNIKLKQVNKESLGNSGSPFESSGISVFSGTVNTATDWIEFPFEEAFYWNGSNDILVDLCFDNQFWSDDDYISTEMTSFVSVNYQNGDAAHGCAFQTVGGISNQRPIIQFFSGGSVVLADLTCKKSTTIYQGDKAHFYTDGKLIASIENFQGGDIGCMEMQIDRIGEGILYPSWMQGYGLTEKTFYIDAMFDAPYKLSLYFDPEELAVWPDPMGLNLLKSTGRVSDADENTFQLLLNDELTISTLSSGVIVYSGVFCDFSGFALTDLIPSALPLKLMAFEAEKQTKLNRLSWEFELGSDLSGQVEVHRSIASSEHFELVKSIDILTDNKFEYYDYNIEESKINYRLKMIDDNGYESYSEIESIFRNEFENNLLIYPNPVLKQLTIKIDDQSMKIENLSIYNSQWKLIKSLSNPKITEGKTINVNLEDYKKGIYYLYVLSENGKTYIQKLFKI